MTTHKAIREALEAATKNGWQTHVADNEQLRALLADLDAKTAEVERLQALRPVPMTEEKIRSLCKEDWVFETVKQWVRIVETHHSITQKEQGK